MNIIEKIVVCILTPIFLMVLYVVFVWGPVNIYTKAECLREGYPEARVSIGLERYCTTLEGAITARVDKQ